jgi:hypothetical protein
MVMINNNIINNHCCHRYHCHCHPNHLIILIIPVVVSHLNDMILHSIKLPFQNISDFTVYKIHCNCDIKVCFKAYNVYKWLNGKICCRNCG